ncbi:MULTISPECIES: glycosyltransferase [unclassified Microbacterium]|uniref:glycosyltransferase n=1 Tax=unclassified Microbacterium TaxID=2609290 RepID=UPI00214C4D82|nr:MULTISPECIES: glycosyltransferase [unclassified Microbacterium]MCR2800533.1 glycosyltransferase [Microbacterium sp. zg.Y818]MCR2825901.1 glycosyltransferase [Microbacterium sp. zg.Y909]WIM23967.1 glycosyltransferase [Microbacterium sp. zg-Y818]
MWSLITVTYNSAPDLRTFWSHLRLEDGVEWIVVDNGSADDSVAIAESLGARVFHTGRNVGFAAANNLGLRMACGDLVLFANPDLRVQIADLTEIGRLLALHGGLISPRLTHPDGCYQYNGRGWPFLLWKVGNRLGRRDTRAQYLRTVGDREHARVVWITGAAVAARRADFEAIGTWDESYFLYNEDVELGLRALRRGLSVGVAGGIEWVHGWSRDPANWRMRAIVRELVSTVKFYRREPLFLLWPAALWRGSLDQRLRRRYGIGLDDAGAPV